MMVILQARRMNACSTKQQQVSYLVLSEEHLLLSILIDIVHARHSSVLNGFIFDWKKGLQKKKCMCVKGKRKCVY